MAAMCLLFSEKLWNSSHFEKKATTSLQQAESGMALWWNLLGMVYICDKFKWNIDFKVIRVRLNSSMRAYWKYLRFYFEHFVCWIFTYIIVFLHRIMQLPRNYQSFYREIMIQLIYSVFRKCILPATVTDVAAGLGFLHTIQDKQYGLP